MGASDSLTCLFFFSSLFFLLFSVRPCSSHGFALHDSGQADGTGQCVENFLGIQEDCPLLVLTRRQDIFLFASHCVPSDSDASFCATDGLSLTPPASEGDSYRISLGSPAGLATVTAAISIILGETSSLFGSLYASLMRALSTQCCLGSPCSLSCAVRTNAAKVQRGVARFPSCIDGANPS